MIKFTTYPSSGIAWTSDVRHIDIALDTDKQVVFELKAFHDDAYITVFSASYYSYDKTVSVRAIAYTLEAWMRSAGVSIARFSIRAAAGGEAATATFIAVYSATQMNVLPTKWLTSRYLTTLSSICVPSTGEVLLPYITDDDTAEAIFKGTYLKDGVSTAFETSYLPEPDIFADNYLAGVIDASPSIVAGLASVEASQLQTYSVVYGTRVFAVLISPAIRIAPTLLRFRNQFNAVEAVALEGMTTRKTDIERSEAVIDGESKYYDQSVTRSCELQTAPLSYDEALWMEQLYSSYEVSDPQGNKILITDSTAEVSDDFSGSTTHKITWRYADGRISADRHQYALPADRTFQPPFDIQFT